MASKRAVRTCGNSMRTYSLEASDNDILARQTLIGLLSALVFLGVPFLMAVLKQMGWF